MPRGWNFPRFEGNAPLLPQLTATRLNGILDALERCYVQFGDNVTGIRTSGGVILRAEAGGDGGSSSVRTPFLVTKGTSSIEEDAKVNIQPGSVLGVVPNIEGVLITATPTPPTLAFSENGMVLLRVNISGFSPTSFRPAIADLTLNKQDGFDIKDDDHDPLNELTMIWDDEDDKTSGYFYIRVANVFCLTPDPPAPQIPGISKIDQMLFTNAYDFVIIEDDVVLLST